MGQWSCEIPYYCSWTRFLEKKEESVSTFAMRYEDLFIKYQQAALHVVSSSSSSVGDPKGSLAMEHLKMRMFMYALDSL